MARLTKRAFVLPYVRKGGKLMTLQEKLSKLYDQVKKGLITKQEFEERILLDFLPDFMEGRIGVSLD